MYFNVKKDLDYALRFTEVYKSESDKARREAKCLEMQFPYVLAQIGDDDLIVGSMEHGYVGFSPQYGGIYTYYFHDENLCKALDTVRDDLSEDYLEKIENMREFWKMERTEAKVINRFEKRYHKNIESDESNLYYYGACRIAGMNVDLSLLVESGLCGLKEKISVYSKINDNPSFYESLIRSVEIIENACEIYENRAAELIKNAAEPRKSELNEIRGIFKNIKSDKPKTFKEALQLIWIYSVCSDLMNYGRLDDILGDFYVRDIKSGILTEEEAIRWLSSFYKNIIRVGKVHDSRIIIGGAGRKNPENADRLALVLIETSKRVMDVVPQLTLRYESGGNAELMEKTLENIAAGAVYPIVYSDDVVVPSVEKSYGISREMAEKWVPFGCGEYIIEGYGAATPNTGITLARALDVVLHEGYDSFSKTKQAEGVPPVSEFKTFEDLFSAYSDMLKKVCEEMAFHEELNYKTAGQEAAYLHLSLLVHDCIERGLPIFSGGCRYLCATSEIFGLITAADSLTAIKKLVYDEKKFTLSELVHMIDENYEGYEPQRQMLLSAPKYGNDNDEADQMAVRVMNHISNLHNEAGKETGLYRYNVVSVNNSGSAEQGAKTSATACGRKRGEPLSNGNSPSIGGDKNGLTATLNSMKKFDPASHVGVVHNIRFNKQLLKNQTEKIRFILEAFYEDGGVQTNLSSIGKDDLEQAMIHPERYQNLLVRIGGFSARFVELSPIIQHEILLRTTIEEV
jgi:pyruvate-formate lyase